MWTQQADEPERGPVILTEGILAGTAIATPEGWRRAGDLEPGDWVLTFDCGAQPVLRVWHQALPPDSGWWPQRFWPLRVPVGALDNREEILLLADQKVLLESDAAESLYGDPFALIPAYALLGYHGIERCRWPQDGRVQDGRVQDGRVVGLGFASDQILYASRAALLACPGGHGDPLLGWAETTGRAETTRRAETGGAARPADLARADYAPLTGEQARHLVACLIAEEAGAALRRAGAPQATFF